MWTEHPPPGLLIVHDILSNKSTHRRVKVCKKLVGNLAAKAGMERSAMTGGVRCSPPFHCVSFRHLFQTPTLYLDTPLRVPMHNKDCGFVNVCYNRAITLTGLNAI